MLKSQTNFVMLGTILGAMACGATLALVGALETWIIADLGVEHTLNGTMQSALFACNLVGALAASWLMCKLRPWRLGLFAILLKLAGTLLSGVRTFELIILARLLTGLGYSGDVIFYGASIVHALPQWQVTYQNIYPAAFAIGVGGTLLVGRAGSKGYVSKHSADSRQVMG